MNDCIEKIYIKMLQMQVLRKPATPPEEVAGDHVICNMKLFCGQNYNLYIIHVDEI
jgi:hypothetical protein